MKKSKMIVSLIILMISCKKYSDDQIHPNLPPKAKAGTDQIIVLPTDSVLLDGSLSFDPDGQIREWRWTKIAGHSFSIISNNTALAQVKRSQGRNLSV